FFSSRRRHTRSKRDWSSDVCSSDLTLSRRLQMPLVGCEVGRPLPPPKSSKVPDKHQTLREEDPSRIRYLTFKDHGENGSRRVWQIGRASCRERKNIGECTEKLKT